MKIAKKYGLLIFCHYIMIPPTGAALDKLMHNLGDSEKQLYKEQKVQDRIDADYNTNVEQCEDYARSLKFFYMIGILAVYLILLVRVVLWVMLISTIYRAITGFHATPIPINVEPDPELICIKHNHDCGESNNPCSTWLTRWRARIKGTDASKTFIINTVGSNPSSQPQHICKQGNVYTYPCKTMGSTLYKLFTLMLLVMVIEVIYNGYLYTNDCNFTFKTIYGLPSYVMLVIFIVVYLIILSSMHKLGDGFMAIKDDIVSFINLF